MALCIKVKDARGVAYAFSKVDAMHKHVALADGDDRDGAIGPDDEYHMAPYTVVCTKQRKSKHNPIPASTVWLVFTGNKVREAHYNALNALGAHAVGIRLFSSVGDIREGGLGSKIPQAKLCTFRHHACDGGDHVCTRLYEKAYEAACVALGVNVEEGWQTMRDIETDIICSNGDVRASPLAKLPEWGEVPFGHLSPAEAAAQKLAAEESIKVEAEDRKRDREKSKHLADEHRAKRYAPSIDKYKDALIDKANPLCAFVFTTQFDGDDGETPCTYDRLTTSAFCSQCLFMLNRSGGGGLDDQLC